MKRAAPWFASLVLAGCAGTPPPAPALPGAQQTQPIVQPAEDERSGPALQFTPGQKLPAQWWTLFQSPALTSLVEHALQNSPGLVKARARLTQAQEQFNATSGATKYPQVDAKLSANRVDLGGQTPPGLPVQTPLNLYLATVGVSYTLDLFGANRHELQALQAEVDYQGYELEAARLILAGNVVTAAIREAALREQIESTQELIAIKAQQVGIARRLQGIGTLSQGELAAMELDLTQARAQLPALQSTLAQVRHRLAVLSGQTPGSMQAPALRLADLRLPGELPGSLPSELARQRPDIRAAQALLDQSAAKLGVATANLYPQIRLSATVGEIASSGQLFGSGTPFYLLGVQLAQPLFRGGELQARRRAAVAAFEQAGAAWQEVILQGLQNVADVMRALQADADTLRFRAEASEQAQRYLDIATDRHRAGGISTRSLLDARLSLQNARLARIQALADNYTDTAALFQALGGGWEQEPGTAPPPQAAAK